MDVEVAEHGEPGGVQAGLPLHSPISSVFSPSLSVRPIEKHLLILVFLYPSVNQWRVFESQFSGWHGKEAMLTIICLMYFQKLKKPFEIVCRLRKRWVYSPWFCQKNHIIHWRGRKPSIHQQSLYTHTWPSFSYPVLLILQKFKFHFSLFCLGKCRCQTLIFLCVSYWMIHKS